MLKTLEFKNLSYKVSYRDVKYPRIELGLGNLHFILPFNQDPEVIYEKHKKWIKKKVEFVENCLREARDAELVERTDKDFRDIVYSIVNKNSGKTGKRINKIFFRMMKTKWASCSAKRNLTINRLMRQLPEHLIEYIVFHEIAHLKQKRHNHEFWEIISKKFCNYEALERELFIYWFKLASMDFGSLKEDRK